MSNYYHNAISTYEYMLPQCLATTPTQRRYTGQIQDFDTVNMQLYFYNARYYDPELSRFTQADTIVPEPGNPQTLNRFSYTLNNPIRYIDPTGHETEDGCASIQAADQQQSCYDTRWYRANGYEKRSGLWRYTGNISFVDLGIAAEVLDTLGIIVDNLQDWTKNELETLTQGFFDLANKVGGKDHLIGLLYSNLEMDIPLVKGTCPKGQMCYQEGKQGDQLIRRQIKITQGAFDSFKDSVTKAFFVHELAHAIDSNFNNLISAGFYNDGYDLTNRGIASDTKEYYAEGVALWVYPTYYYHDFRSHFQNSLTVDHIRSLQTWLKRDGR